MTVVPLQCVESRYRFGTGRTFTKWWPARVHLTAARGQPWVSDPKARTWFIQFDFRVWRRVYICGMTFGPGDASWAASLHRLFGGNA